MKVVLDSCLSRLTMDRLRDAGVEASWVGEWSEDPGDEMILAWAYREHRVLVTLDRDFGELAVLYRRPHAGIVRLVDIDADEHADRCLRALERHAGALEVGAIVTVERDRTRVRMEEDA